MMDLGSSQDEYLGYCALKMPCGTSNQMWPSALSSVVSLSTCSMDYSPRPLSCEPWLLTA